MSSSSVHVFTLLSAFFPKIFGLMSSFQEKLNVVAHVEDGVTVVGVGLLGVLGVIGVVESITSTMGNSFTL